MSLRVAFFGTPDFAIPTLDALLASGHDIAAVYTRAPKPAGRRGLAVTPSPVQARAERAGLAVRTPGSLRDPEVQAAFADLHADVGVVVAYGLILPGAVLAGPVHGCLNLHPSLLPRWRGAAPIARPLIAGDTDTAICIMRMDEGLDTGPVAIAEGVAIDPDETAGDLHDRLAIRGAALVVEALERLAGGALTLEPQAEHGVLYADKIGKAEARIDWSRPAPAVHNLVRGLSPFPGAWFEADLGRGPERIKVLRTTLLADGAGAAPGTVLDGRLAIACGEGAIRLERLQRAGKAPTDAADFLRGTSVAAGKLLCPASS